MRENCPGQSSKRKLRGSIVGVCGPYQPFLLPSIARSLLPGQEGDRPAEEPGKQWQQGQSRLRLAGSVEACGKARDWHPPRSTIHQLAFTSSPSNLDGHSCIAKPCCENISETRGGGQYAAALRAARQPVSVHCQAQSRLAKKFDGGAIPWVTLVANEAMRFPPAAGQAQQLTAEPSLIHGFL
jgi:hypothetical protein